MDSRVPRYIGKGSLSVRTETTPAGYAAAWAATEQPSGAPFAGVPNASTPLGPQAGPVQPAMPVQPPVPEPEPAPTAAPFGPIVYWERISVPGSASDGGSATMGEEKAPSQGRNRRKRRPQSATPPDPSGWRNNVLLMTLLAAIIALYVAFTAESISDNDIWFILATGREIVEHGIPYLNPFSIHENMGIVVQQWVPCVIAYGLYCLGGFVAVGLCSVILTALLVLSLYRLGRQLKGDRFGGEWILGLTLVALPALDPYLSMRPHAYSMLAFVWLIFFLEKYRGSNQPGWLAGCLAIVAAHGNFQMALAPFDLAIIASYALPDLLAPLHRRDRAESVQLADASYRRLPLLACLLVGCIALLANPYGVDGALYLVSSYGSAGYLGFIQEMRPMTPWALGLGGASTLVMLGLAAAAVGKRGLRSIDLPLVLVALAGALLAFPHSRNLWLAALLSFPIAATVMHGWSLDFARWRPEAASRMRSITNLCALAVGICAAAVTAFLLWQAVPAFEDYEKESPDAPQGLVDYMERQGVDKQEVRLFNPFNIGGYLEWKGFKVFMDPRPELWDSGISGLNEDHYREYADMIHSGDWTDRDFQEFLDRYRFDYLIVEKDSSLNTYLTDFTDEYVNVLGTGNYILWEKRNVPAGQSAS